MLRDRDGVAVTLDLDQEFGVVRRDIDPVDDFGFLDESLQFGDRQPIRFTLLALRHFGRGVFVVF